MSGKMKLAAAAGFVGAVAMSVAAFAQTGSAAPSSTLGATQVAAAQGRPCGTAIRPKQVRMFSRMVGSETKIRTASGFAVLRLDVGDVTAVNATSIAIKRADGETVTVRPAESTRICRDGKSATLAQIKVGDKAAIAQVTKEGKTTVRSVRALSAGALERLQQAAANRKGRGVGRRTAGANQGAGAGAGAGVSVEEWADI